MDNSTDADSTHVEFCRTLKWSPSWPSTIGSTAITCIASPLAILLNVLLIYAVMNKKRLQSVSNILFASMAVSDLLIGAVAQPLFLTAGIFRLLNDYKTMCTFILAGFFVMYLQSASVYHLAVMAWQRYIAIKNGMNYKFIVSRSRLKIFITTAWVLTALAVVPTALYAFGLVGKKLRSIANACLFTIPLSTCLLATVFLYIMIYLESRNRKVNATTFSNVQVAKAILEKKIAKTAFLLTVALVVSFVPTFVFIFLTYLVGFNDRDAYIWSVTIIQLNSCTSPILYFYRNRRFRRNIVLEMLRIRKHKTNAIAPRAGRKDKPTNDIGKALQMDTSNNIGTTSQSKHRRVKSNSYTCLELITMFGEIQEAMNQALRPKSALTRTENGATPKNKTVTTSTCNAQQGN